MKQSDEQSDLTSDSDLSAPHPAPTISPPSQPGKRTSKLKSIDTALAFARARTEEVQLARDQAVGCTILQKALPFWDEDNRGVPNHFLRAGLFGVGQDKARAFKNNERVVSLSNYVIRATGEELYQDDLSVWMSLLCMARNSPISEMVYFSGYSLIKDLGWSINSKSYDRIKASIRRLKNNALEIGTTDKKTAYSGSLLREYAFSSKGNDTQWWVRFEPEMAKLLLSDTTTLLEWQIRKKLGSRATLCQWVHGFYSSHRDPIIPYAVTKLHELCGSKTSHMPSFQRSLEQALARLVKEEFFTEYSITARMVRVKKHRIDRLAQSPLSDGNFSLGLAASKAHR